MIFLTNWVCFTLHQGWEWCQFQPMRVKNSKKELTNHRPRNWPHAQLWPPTAIPQHFPCNICGKVFTTPGSLRNHDKIHTGATHCTICGKKLATISSLNRHVSHYHKDVNNIEWNTDEYWKIVLDFNWSFIVH